MYVCEKTCYSNSTILDVYYLWIPGLLWHIRLGHWEVCHFNCSFARHLEEACGIQIPILQVQTESINIYVVPDCVGVPTDANLVEAVGTQTHTHVFVNGI